MEATEAFARTQLQLKRPQRKAAEGVFYYVPVIVTNATLFVCEFDASKVDLNDGKLPANAKFREVPVVRFFKNLLIEDPNEHKDLGHLVAAQNRTVLVVTASAFAAFLNAFEHDSGGTQWPPQNFLK